jgi:hypothetical protein
MSELKCAEGREHISNEAVLASLETILNSKTFSHSPSLRQVLELIVRNSLSSPLEPIKEHTMATEVLGRAGDFDPKADNIVRVQMHRLREKLEKYHPEFPLWTSGPTCNIHPTPVECNWELGLHCQVLPRATERAIRASRENPSGEGQPRPGALL